MFLYSNPAKRAVEKQKLGTGRRIGNEVRNGEIWRRIEDDHDWAQRGYGSVHPGG